MKVSRNYDYYEDEKLYSTGDYELDDLLEKAFCEGYEYAQREFNSKAMKAINNNRAEQLGKAVRALRHSPNIASEYSKRHPDGDRRLGRNILRTLNSDELAGRFGSH